MKNILFILMMMIGLSSASQERLFEYDFYPDPVTIPFDFSIYR